MYPSKLIRFGPKPPLNLSLVAGFPVTSTWCKAIDAGYFRGWPSLTSARVRKFIKVVEETEKGHMDQRKVGIRSTSKSKKAEPDSMTTVPQAPNNDKTHEVYMSISEMEGKLFSDQTGRFPITSNRGNCYVIIFYVADGNFIKSYPIKSRHRSSSETSCTSQSRPLS